MLLRLNHLDRICLVAVIIVSLSSGYVVARASIRQKREVQLELEQRTKKSNEMKLAETNLRVFNRTQEETRTNLNALNEKIPVSGSIGTFLKQLDIMMKEKNMALLSVQPQTAQIETLFTRIPIQLVFRGSFDRVHQAVHHLEALKRIVRLEKMTIMNQDKNEVCQVDLTLSTFEQGSETGHDGK